MAKDESFVETVAEMIEEGHDLSEIVETLVSLGLSRPDAEKLVRLMEDKAMPKVEQTVRSLVDKKVISAAAARALKIERRVRSRKRREEETLGRAFRLGEEVFRQFFPRKHLEFIERWRKFSAARKNSDEARKDLQALFLEIDGKNLPDKALRDIDKALKLLE